MIKFLKYFGLILYTAFLTMCFISYEVKEITPNYVYRNYYKKMAPIQWMIDNVPPLLVFGLIVVPAFGLAFYSLKEEFKDVL